jgi:hypothetical protein
MIKLKTKLKKLVPLKSWHFLHRPLLIAGVTKQMPKKLKIPSILNLEFLVFNYKTLGVAFKWLFPFLFFFFFLLKRHLQSYITFDL